MYRRATCTGDALIAFLILVMLRAADIHRYASPEEIIA
jgi:hypothetical protein